MATEMILTPEEISSLESCLPFATAGELREMEKALQRAMAQSLTGFAEVTSGGEWILAPHLARLETAITDTITGMDGIRNLMVMMPPRHGKSELCSKYLPAWFLCRNPRKKVILASYESTFAASWGRKARELIEEWGQRLFRVVVSSSSSAADNWEVAKYKGGMHTAGVGSGITGKGASLLIVDDPFKDHEEAHSKLIRDKVWDWWRSTAITRLEPDGAKIIIQTRWHEDDLCGRLLNTQSEKWRVCRMPAVSDSGKALWPGRFGLSEFESIREDLGTYLWSALYQQSPIPDGGGFFKREWFPIVDSMPSSVRLRGVRYWDKAGSEPGSDGDSSAGVAIFHDDQEGVYYVADVVHGQWSPFNRNKTMRQTAELDAERYHDIQLWIEQEPGNGGKESAMISLRELAKFGARIDKPQVAKTLRARPFAAQCEAGNVRLVRGAWNGKYIDELAAFPHGEHDDQVDGSSGAFNKLVMTTKTSTAAAPRGVRSRI